MNNDFKRFRAVDLCLILLALFAVIGVFRRAGTFQAKNAAGTQKEYIAEAVWADVDSRTEKCLQTGEWLYTNAGERFGQIINLSAAPRKISVREEGSEFSAIFPDGTREDVFLTVLLTGDVHEGVFLRENGRAVLLGESYRLYSARTAVTLTIRSVSPV